MTATLSIPSFSAPHVHIMADVHIPSFRQFRHPVVMTPVTLNPRSRTTTRVAGLVSHFRRIATPADTPTVTQPIGTQPQPVVQGLTSMPEEQGSLQSVAVSLPQPPPVAESTAMERGVSQGGAQEQV